MQVLFAGDEFNDVGMGDVHSDHQRSPSPVLCHLPGGIGETLHKGHRTGSGTGSVTHKHA